MGCHIKSEASTNWDLGSDLWVTITACEDSTVQTGGNYTGCP